MTKKIYSLFYYFLLYSVLSSMVRFLSLDFTSSSFSSISGGVIPSINVFVFFLPTILGICILTLLVKQTRIISALVSFLYALYIFLPLDLSGKMAHSQITTIYASFFIIFFDVEKKMHKGNNLILLRLIQFAILSTYFNSGLWKIRMAIKSGSLIDFFNAPLEHFAYSVAEGSNTIILVNEVMTFSLFQTCLRIGFIAVIAFQISTILPIFKPKLLKYYGFAILFFHALNSMVLGISFAVAAVTAFLFLSIAETAQEEQRH